MEVKEEPRMILKFDGMEPVSSPGINYCPEIKVAFPVS